MSDFNYIKAYCVHALPAYNNFNANQVAVFNTLLKTVGKLKQQHNLNIQLSKEYEILFKILSNKELAEMSRASYFTGHWFPSHLEHPFNNSKGESWKIANLCDQVLRKRFTFEFSDLRNIEIHQGMLRVTFSNKDCWLWREFALATSENFITYKDCNLRFGEESLDKSATELKNTIGDMWCDVDEIADNELYTKYLVLEKENKLANLKERQIDELKTLQQKIANAEKEYKAIKWLIEQGIDTDNVIYYNHKDTFCFGWRDALSVEEKTSLENLLTDFEFNYELK